MNAVTNRVNALIGHLEKEIARLTAAHKDREDRCDRVNRRVNDLEGELRLAKQTIDSIERVKGK